jgi:NADH:ubiquinone oxidoreductase subunit E
MIAQEQEGWVTKAAIETIADMLGMPYIRVLGSGDLLHHVPARAGR